MKYYKELDMDKSKTIGKYEIKDNKIIVIFLDGKKVEIDYTDFNENLVKQEMLEQAEKIYEQMKNVNKFSKQNIKNIIIIALNILGICSLEFFAKENKQITPLIILGILGLDFLSVPFLLDEEVEKDKEKYELFFEIRKLLENNKDNLSSLDINKIDSYSNEDLNELLNKIKIIYEYSDNKQEEKKLTKNILEDFNTIQHNLESSKNI